MGHAETPEDYLRRDARIWCSRRPGLLLGLQSSHYVTATADPWPDHIRLSDLEPRFVCTACGQRGAGIRPDFHWDKPGLLTRGY
jgi:hypothetical protein